MFLVRVVFSPPVEGANAPELGVQGPVAPGGGFRGAEPPGLCLRLRWAGSLLFYGLVVDKAAGSDYRFDDNHAGRGSLGLVLDRGVSVFRVGF